jgi:hypothetical protein
MDMSKRPRTTPDGTPGSPRVAISDALRLLYAAPLDEFVFLRKKLSSELRVAGDVEGAREVSGAKKPSRTAWAINRVARKNPDLLHAAFDAFDAAARAQSRGDATMREAAQVFRERVSAVVQECARLVGEDGASFSPAQARHLSETIRADISRGGPSRERLLSGSLTEESEPADPFAGLEAETGLVASPEREPVPTGDHDADAEQKRARELDAERAREAERARQARERAIQEARQRVAELEAEARDARDAATAAEAAALEARTEAERARRHADALEVRLGQARAALGEA